MEKRLGWFGGRTVLLKGSSVSEHHLMIRDAPTKLSGRVGAGPGRRNRHLYIRPPRPHDTVTSRLQLPFFLQLSLPFSPLRGPWVTLTVTSLSLNVTENLEGKRQKGEASAPVAYAHIFMMGSPPLLEANIPHPPGHQRGRDSRELGWETTQLPQALL